MRCWMGNHRGGVERVSSLNSREKAERLKCKEHVALTWKKYPYVFQGEYNLLVEGSKTQQGSVPEPPLHFHVPFLPSSTPTILGIQGPHNPPPCTLPSAMLTSSHQCSPAASSVDGSCELRLLRPQLESQLCFASRISLTTTSSHSQKKVSFLKLEHFKQFHFQRESSWIYVCIIQTSLGCFSWSQKQPQSNRDAPRLARQSVLADFKVTF